jgi:hypothetical protein
MRVERCCMLRLLTQKQWRPPLVRHLQQRDLQPLLHTRGHDKHLPCLPKHVLAVDRERHALLASLSNSLYCWPAGIIGGAAGGPVAG